MSLAAWKCKCGHSANVAPGVKVRCSKCGAISGPVGPALVRRMSNYAKARKRWTDAGKPVRTDEHVEQLRAICRGCELFNGEVCTHQNCGCPVTRPGIWGDKLRWATEACPIATWGARDRAAD